MNGDGLPSKDYHSIPIPDDVEKIESETNANTDIAWSQLTYIVGNKKILNNCYGSIRGGSLCAIMGPSGARKTSLLNVLAGRLATKSGVVLSGMVCVGGQRINPVTFRKHIANVMQENTLSSTGTAREAFRFSATLRLPSSTTGEINNIVDRTIANLGLQHVADVQIGNPLNTGISGGERKRISVGVEIITDPKLLFLDEPTSGLDSFSASHLVKLLRDIAQRHATILCTIHQPSSSVFASFDQCIFMKNGKIFYQGQPISRNPSLYYTYLLNGQEMLRQWLTDWRSLNCPPNFNPSDFVMLTLQTLTMEEMETSCMMKENATEHERLIMLLEQCPQSASQDGAFVPIIHASNGKQLMMLTIRKFLRTIRDVGSLMARFGVTTFLSILIGLIFLGAGGKSNANPTTFSAHFGGIMITTIASTFGAAQPTMLGFPLERPLFIREYSTGTYTAIMYFLSKVVIEVPLTFLQSLLQYIIVYFMMDLQGVFIYEVLAAFGLGMAATSLAVVVGCAISDARHVTEVAPLVFVPQFLFAGFFIRTSNILSFCVGLSTFVRARACRQVLVSNNIDENRWWVYMLILVSLFLGFRILAAIILARKAQQFY